MSPQLVTPPLPSVPDITDIRLSSVPEPASQEWLTKEQAAEMLRTTERTIARWIAERRISTHKSPPQPGKRSQTLCDPADIERLQGEMSKNAVLQPDTQQQRTNLETAVIARIPQMLGQLANAIAVSNVGPTRPFMDIEDASRYSGLPRRLILKLIRSGKLPAVEHSATFYVSKRDLDNLDMRPDVSL